VTRAATDGGARSDAARRELVKHIGKVHNSAHGYQEADVQRATSIRNQIGPLLDRLIHQLEAEGSATQRAYFSRIQRELERAQHEGELATPIRELTSTTAVGFSFSTDAGALIARILEKAEQLGRDLDVPPQTLH
jgi:hypothetical protein